MSIDKTTWAIEFVKSDLTLRLRLKPTGSDKFNNKIKDGEAGLASD